ncbi:hypothetical protein CUMW_210430 [Citrus unshiu]|uniref:Uncharacterized protein n=1 Tax=Citrus unshiu TaxID=55188 RepID=A0A2H5QA21_CITUN|nr:hypothetical protein CUMW_210430 [Citrus unshiu]
MKRGFEDQQLKKIGVPDLEIQKSTEMLERQEEEARSLIFCHLPLVEMTPCQRRICEIPGPAQSLTSKSPYYPQSSVTEERSDCAIPWPREFRTRQSPFGKGHQISTPSNTNLLKLAEIIFSHHKIPIVSRDVLLSNLSAIDSSFEQLQTSSTLRDGGRLPTSRDSSVAETDNSQCVSAQEEMRQSNLRKGNKGTALVDFYLSQGTEAER